MGYRVLKGYASIDGKSPDGDTIAFRISNSSEWMWPKNQNGRFPKFNMQYQTSIRFEGVDALELHYQISEVSPAVVVHQPLVLAKKARDRMLGVLGFDMGNVSEKPDHSLSDPLKQERPVTIAYNGIDPYGRVIGFVFEGHLDIEISDSKPMINLTPEEVSKSVNATLLNEGLVFPTFYGGLYPELRERLRMLAKNARDAKIGVWESYVDAIEIDNKPEISVVENFVLMPKLFRRLSENLAKNGDVSGFRTVLKAGKDLAVDLVEIRMTDFSSFVHVEKLNGGGYKLGLKYGPGDMVFVEG